MALLRWSRVLAFGLAVAGVGMGLNTLVIGSSDPYLPVPPPSPRTYMLMAGYQPMPATLEESLQTLEDILPADIQVRMRVGREEDMFEFWDGLGLWIRNHWLMGNERKPLAHWFQKHYRVRDAEDICSIVLRSYWRRLNGEPIDIDRQIRDLRAPSDVVAPPPPPRFAR